MIDDPELRILFRAESEEHLQKLENGLLQLESTPGDTALIEGLFRSAHSLKGAARMLGITELETLAHHFEDELGAARRGHRAMSSKTADRLYQGVDAMRELAKAACGDSGSDVATSAEIEPAVARSQSPGATSPPTPIPPTAPEPPAETFPDASPEAVALATFKIETIRVEPQMLDALAILAAQMAVTTERAARALEVIGELVDLGEKWSRDSVTTNAALRGAVGGHLVLDTKVAETELEIIRDRESSRQKLLTQLLGRLERARDEHIGRLELMSHEMIEAIRDIRLLPFSTIFNLFPRMVRDLSRAQGKEVQLNLVGGTITADKHLLEAMKDPLMHLIRNAIDHAVESPEQRELRGKPRQATIQLSASRIGSRVSIEVSDDGQGLNDEAIRRTALKNRVLSETEVARMSTQDLHNLVFASGFSTNTNVTDVSGRGVGLDVVRKNVERLNGFAEVVSDPGVGCTFRIEVPITLETTHVILVRCGHSTYAVPIDAVQETFRVPQRDMFWLEGRPAIQNGNHPLWVAHLHDLLQLPQEALPNALRSAQQPDRRSDRGPAEAVLSGIVVVAGKERVGLFVDDLLGERRVILKPFGGLLQRVRNVLGSTILSSGEICMVLNSQDLIKSVQNLHTEAPPEPPSAVADRKKRVLLAEDSITTRTQEKRILESAGYEVVTAVDGADAFSKLAVGSFDAVVSDVEMPNMTGLQLTMRIRQIPKHKDLPIILVTSLASDEQRQHGIECGANAYLAKGTFDQKALLEALRRLV